MDWTLTELCDSVRQSGITEDPVSSSKRQTESIYTVWSVRCNSTNPFIETKCEFRGISRSASSSYNRFSSSPGDFRQKGGKLIGRRFTTDGKPFRQLSSPSNRYPLPSRLLLVDIVFIIGLKPSTRLSPRLSFIGSKRLYPLARGHVFFRFATFPKLRWSLLLREAKQRVKDVSVFPSTGSSPSFYDCANGSKEVVLVGVHLS